MEGTLKEIGKLAGMIGSRLRILILGVMVPGFIIVCELAVFMAAGDDGADRLIAWADAIFQSPYVSVPLLVFLLFAVSYLLGYLSREFAFALSTAWLRRGWPPNRRASIILGQLRTIHGPERVDTVIANHPVFDLARRENDSAVRALPRPSDFYIREYCKLWLRMKAPSLSTEHMEVEINLVMGLVLPILLAVIPCVLLLPDFAGPIVAGCAVVFVLLIDFRFFYNINSVRCQETEEAILNFLFAHWTGLDAPKTPEQKAARASDSDDEAENDDNETITQNETD
jgi:hypothetical protein